MSKRRLRDWGFLKRKALIRLRSLFSFFRLFRHAMHVHARAGEALVDAEAVQRLLSAPVACSKNACARSVRR